MLVENIIDQIPNLVDLQKFLEQLSIIDPPASPQNATRFLIEQLPEIREQLLKQHWTEVISAQREILTSNGAFDMEGYFSFH
jgi:hypothetical protein